MIVIVDYGMGNLRSIQKSFNALNVEAKISNDPNSLKIASKIILPGVGNFKKGITNLFDQGWIEPLRKSVIENNIPILGICLGMQLLTKFSQEGNCKGLGWIELNTISFDIQDSFKIPHVGWNTLANNKESLLLKNITVNDTFYFVHSYHVEDNKIEKNIISYTDYGLKFPSIIQKGNIFGVQFHPEKSYDSGRKILTNFINV
jgi:glutamine amidotransferase